MSENNNVPNGPKEKAEDGAREMTTTQERLAKIYAHEINMQHDIRKSIEAVVEAAFLKGYEVGFRRGNEEKERATRGCVKNTKSSPR